MNEAMDKSLPIGATELQGIKRKGWPKKQAILKPNYVVKVKRERGNFRILRLIRKKDGRLEVHCWGGTAYTKSKEGWTTGKGNAAYRVFVAQRINKIIGIWKSKSPDPKKKQLDDMVDKARKTGARPKQIQNKQKKKQTAEQRVEDKRMKKRAANKPKRDKIVDEAREKAKKERQETNEELGKALDFT